MSVIAKANAAEQIRAASQAQHQQFRERTRKTLERAQAKLKVAQVAQGQDPDKALAEYQAAVTRGMQTVKTVLGVNLPPQYVEVLTHAVQQPDLWAKMFKDANGNIMADRLAEAAMRWHPDVLDESTRKIFDRTSVTRAEQVAPELRQQIEAQAIARYVSTMTATPQPTGSGAGVLQPAGQAIKPMTMDQLREQLRSQSAVQVDQNTRYAAN
jgi:hypothetical protein